MEPNSKDYWSQSIIYNMVIKSSIIFNQALNEWYGVAAEKTDLIDPNLSSVNTKRVDTWIKTSLNHLIFKAIKISNELDKDKDKDFINYNEIQQKLSDEFEKILFIILILIFSNHHCIYYFLIILKLFIIILKKILII